MDRIRRLSSLCFVVLFAYSTAGCKDGGIFSNSEDDSQTKLTLLYDVTVVAQGAGVVTPESFSGMQEGSLVEFIAIPDDGHKLEVVGGDCGLKAVKDSDDEHTFTVGPLTRDCQVQVGFGPKEFALTTPTYDVHVSASEGGSASPSYFSDYLQDQVVEFTVTPEEGYLFDALNGNCFADVTSETGDIKTFSVGPLQQDCDFDVTFAEKLNAASLPVYDVVVKAHGEGQARPHIQQQIEGEKVTFTITPEDNYKLSSLTGDCFSALTETDGDTHTFSVGPLSKDCEIEAHFSNKNFSGFVPTYTVNLNAMGNGQVSIQQEAYLEGEFATFTATPSENYRFETIKGDCFAALTAEDEDNKTFSVGPLVKDCEIDVSFTGKANSEFLAVYELSVTASENGSVSPFFQEVLAGKRASFTVTPNDGYRFDALEGNCLSALESSSGDNRTFTIGPFDKNCSLHARFIEKDNAALVPIYRLETNLIGGNGQVQPAFQEQLEGLLLNLYITPGVGSKVTTFEGTCNKRLENKNGDTYVFEVGPMVKNCTFDVGFAEQDNLALIPEYEVTVNAQGDGEVTPSMQTELAGAFVNFDAIPDDGFRLDSVSGDCLVDFIAVDEDKRKYSIGPLNKNCEMNVSFIKKSNVGLTPIYHFEASVTGEGSVDPLSKYVLQGEPVKFTAIPNEGYRFEALEGNCTATMESQEGELRTFIIDPVEQNCSMSVSFTEKDNASLIPMYDVIINPGEGGTASTQNFHVKQGNDVSFTVSPEPNYRIGKVESTLVSLGGWKCQPVVASGDDDIPTQSTEYMVRNVSGNCGIKVTFFQMTDNDPINTVEHVKVSFNANSGGSINPNHFYAEKGSDIEFTVTPLAGQRIDSVESVPVHLGNETCKAEPAEGDDGDITTATTYAINNLQDDCEVNVGFGTFDSAIQEPEDIIGVRINVAGEVKGTVSKSFVYPNAGEAVTFNVNPTTMFSRIKSVTGDTCSVSVMSNDFNPKNATDYITDDIYESCQISVLFEKIYDVHFNSGGHGEMNITKIFNGSEVTSASGNNAEIVKGSQVEFTVKVAPGYEFSSISYYNEASCGIESAPLSDLSENEGTFKTTPLLDFCRFNLEVALNSNPVCVESGNQLIKVDQSWTVDSPVPAYPPGQEVWAVTNTTIHHPLIINWLVNDQIKIDTTCVTDMSNLFNREYYDEEQLVKFNSNPDFFNGDVSGWVTHNVTNMSHMFRGNKQFNNKGIESWDVSNVTSMEGMFTNTSDKPNDTGFNRNLSNWDVSNVTTMKDMFSGAQGFNNGGIPLWNDDKGPSSNLIDTSGMFSNARSFNQDISNWDMSRVTNMSNMFYGAESFNNAGKPLWNGNVVPGMSLSPEQTLMISGIFNRAHSFNQPINNWITAQVTSFADVFHDAFIFNQPLDNWSTDNVVNMNSTFNHASNFAQPLNSWNTGSVENMSSMFMNMKFFNQDISSWDVSNVKDMTSMFQSSLAFNQDIGNWKVKPEFKNELSYMFFYANQFDQDLTCWNWINLTSKPTSFIAGSASQNSDLPIAGQAPAPECNND
ncbi:hypothetical protein BS333_07875 [Vibrio azureus]|uniref:Bacterial repeat domain-containing protein n=1 Tax=Vibrio azureus NBRC 104587 TaxID=1219077 RepID=U3APQ6_9VIBR|nr:BspA family leucine-rich repeat surface protein [Vibrio azureus]AUI86314.1 hypothetical protein BS333_07875 [Vibrio azureus]GAD75755.1 hypothetical protein VAZ01S_029_00250 [Vibrio azureus NBRC 104587]